MREWHHSAGGVLGNIYLHELEPGNNEVVASDTIRDGELVAFFPEEMFLTTKEAYAKSPNVQILKQNNIIEKLYWPNVVPLTLYLLE